MIQRSLQGDLSVTNRQSQEGIKYKYQKVERKTRKVIDRPTREVDILCVIGDLNDSDR